MLKKLTVNFVISIFITSLLLFLSCANQEQVENEELDAFAEEAAKNVGDDILEISDVDETSKETTRDTKKENEGLENAELGLPTEEELANLEKDDGTPSKENFENAELGLPTEEELANLEKDEVTPPKVEVKAHAEIPATQNTKNEAIEFNDDILGLPSDEEIAKAEETKLEMDEEFDSKSNKPQISKTTKPQKVSTKKDYHLPSIPNSAFTKNGVLVNRYYFIRINDTPSSVSLLLFGNQAFASELLKINPGKWSVGKIIYYKSRKSSNNNMIPFYEEASLAPIEYTVKRGEWLSLIAKKELGSIQSWKELAVLNNLQNANIIEPGQKIVFFDTSSMSSQKQPLVEDTQQINKEEKEDHSKEPTQTSDAFNEQPEISPPPEIQQQVKKATSAIAKRKANISKLISQNIFSIMIGLGVLLLLVALMLAKKKREKISNSEEEINEEDDIFSEKSSKK